MNIAVMTMTATRAIMKMGTAMATALGLLCGATSAPVVVAAVVVVIGCGGGAVV